jgi:HSP20 family protein
MNVRDLIPGSRNDRELTHSARSESLSPMVSLSREMNRLFDNMFRGFDDARMWGNRQVEWPRIDVEETDKNYRVTADLPGMDEKDVEVLLQDGLLTIRGEKKLENESQDRTFSERFYGRFERQLSFDRDVDQEGVTAAFKNGVLTVTIPRTAQAIERRKRIPINAAGKAH